MPNIMFRQHDDGLYCYIAKRDLEAKVALLEYDAADNWGGRVELDNGEAYFLQPQEKPSLPITLRLRRAGEDD